MKGEKCIILCLFKMYYSMFILILLSGSNFATFKALLLDGIAWILVYYVSWLTIGLLCYKKIRFFLKKIKKKKKSMKMGSDVIILLYIKYF